MSESFSAGLLLALWSTAVGAFLCAVNDIFRIVRIGQSKPNRILLFISDIVFCLFASVVFAVLFFNLTYGRVRGYAFAFSLAGFIIWRVTVSRLFMALLTRLFNALAVVMHKIGAKVSFCLKFIHHAVNTRHYCRKTIKKASAGFGHTPRLSKNAQSAVIAEGDYK